VRWYPQFTAECNSEIIIKIKIYNSKVNVTITRKPTRTKGVDNDVSARSPNLSSASYDVNL